MRSKYEGYSVEELRIALKKLWDSPELDSNVSTENQERIIDELEEIVTILRVKAPLSHPHTTEEMWEQFKAEHPCMAKRKRRAVLFFTKPSS